MANDQTTPKQVLAAVTCLRLDAAEMAVAFRRGSVAMQGFTAALNAAYEFAMDEAATEAALQDFKPYVL